MVYVHDGLLEVKVESPSYSPVPGEDSVATDYSGWEDEGGTYLCPAWAIKRRLLHLVYTSAYQGDDCTGAYWASASPGDGVAMRVVARLADTASDSVRDDDGGGTLPQGRTLRAMVPALGGESTLSASVHMRTRGRRGALAPRSPFRNGTGDPFRDPQWGFVRRLGTAFGHCASGKPRTPDPLTRTSGIGTVSGMLLWLLRRWPALTNLWLPCVSSIRPSRLRGSALSGPTRRVTRRGFRRRTRLGRFDVPGPPPRRSPARMVPPPPPMVAGRAI